MKENNPDANYINTDNDVLKVNVNQIPTKKERKKKKILLLKEVKILQLLLPMLILI